MRRVHLWTALLLALLAAGPASAQSIQILVNDCLSSSKSPADRVRACTRAILPGSGLNDHDRALVLNGRGIAHDDNKEYEAAIADYEAAIVLDPKNPDPLVNEAVVYREMGDTAKMRPLLERALAIKPNDPTALWNRASIYIDSGDLGLAWADLHRISPVDSDTRKALATLEASMDGPPSISADQERALIVRCAPANTSDDDTIAACNALLGSKVLTGGSAAYAHGFLAEAYSRKGNLMGAWSSIQTAVSGAPDNARFKDDYAKFKSDWEKASGRP